MLDSRKGIWAENGRELMRKERERVALNVRNRYYAPPIYSGPDSPYAGPFLSLSMHRWSRARGKDERERYYATMTLSARAMLDRVVQGAIRSLSLVSCFETNRMRKGRKGRRRLLDRVKRSAPLSPHRKKKSGRIESEGQQERIG